MTRPRRDDGPLYDDPASLRDVEDVTLPDDEACCADVWVAAANLCGCRGRGA